MVDTQEELNILLGHQNQRVSYIPFLLDNLYTADTFGFECMHLVTAVMIATESNVVIAIDISVVPYIILTIVFTLF